MLVAYGLPAFGSQFGNCPEREGLKYEVRVAVAAHLSAHHVFNPAAGCSKVSDLSERLDLVVCTATPSGPDVRDSAVFPGMRPTPLGLGRTAGINGRHSDAND